MLWLEMSRDETHGGGEWAFTKSLWSPTRKRNNKEPSVEGTKWAHWSLLERVREGDLVLHLRGKGRRAAFVGVSTADTDGMATTERPPSPGEWAYARSFFRVRLRDYAGFADPIPLRARFADEGASLRKYFDENEVREGHEHRHLFFVVLAKNRRLQCLNGAYFSEVDDELAGILLGPDFTGRDEGTRPGTISAATGESIGTIRRRIGQAEFSKNVRDNFGSQCCFPGCEVRDPVFLVGSHIARWADTPELRGQTANGLCFCLMHDRAYEIGLFVISDDLLVLVNGGHGHGDCSTWAGKNILPQVRAPIRVGTIPPNKDALRHHRGRVRYVE